MAERIVVDPITRIEGHLRIEADIKDGVIQKAYSVGTAFRGLEVIVKDRDPRDVWAYVQRICGVCTTVHALASVRSVEDALDIRIPKNAHLIRDIMNAATYIHDHVVHFYHLHAFDWVDVVNALEADPQEASKLAQTMSKWENNSPEYFQDVQRKVKTIVESGQLGIFANGFWGHPAYKLPAELNLIATAHYLEALDWQKEIAKITAIFGGKNPHPHYAVGGMTTPLDIERDSNLLERLKQVSSLIDKAKEFVKEVYLPDLLAIGSYYKEWIHGDGLRNYMTYGDFSTGDIRDVHLYRMPRGIILNGNMQEVIPLDLKDLDQIKEFVDHAWYSYDNQDTGGRHPLKGETSHHYTGPGKAYQFLNTEEKYSWIKSPRWNELPMEVGPLARIMVGYACGKEEIVALVDDTLQKLEIPMDALHSALGRTIARGLESVLVADWMRQDMDTLMSNIQSGDYRTFEGSKWEPSTWPSIAEGVGWLEAPRGALGHWIVIGDAKVTNYQAVVPTTWNASPKDHQGQEGAYEAALAGTPLMDPEKPLEILRIVHSFDPCMACAVHLTDLTTNQIVTVRTE
ncbi:nickel-dependent hydrogenase large subunit [Brevibacillus ginsengisoli]|uniref:nickel-dependent hydrogenase large subunit n=1 Tax=Brevibacillus ginsengisoli TaxID=363854 RepID=UPI003CF05FB7